MQKDLVQKLVAEAGPALDRSCRRCNRRPLDVDRGIGQHAGTCGQRYRQPTAKPAAKAPAKAASK